MKRATINPYRHAAGIVIQRLKWDLRTESFRSRRIIKQYRDKFKDSKAVIVCNGPSLLQTDLSCLKNVYTFGLNKINLLFDKSSFRPSSIVAVNLLVIEQNKDFYNTTALPLFLDSGATKWVRPRPNVAFMPSGDQPKFARDCSMSIAQGYTVTYVAMQLAFHFGFRNVALVGCDHSFAAKGRANDTVLSNSPDKSHFDPNYFGPGLQWQLPDLVGSEFYYQKAGETFSDAGGEIVNCTLGGKLELFRRVELKAWLGNSI